MSSIQRRRRQRGMGLLEAIAVRVATGATVEFRPSGSSMVPLIRSRQLVTVAPVDPTTVEIGDIVLARARPKSVSARQVAHAGPRAA